MAVTRSTSSDRRTAVRMSSPVALFGRFPELVWTALACAFIAGGLHLVWLAKAPALNAAQTIDLNALSAREQLLPPLQIIQNSAERVFVARRIYDASGAFSNVGALARLRVDADETGREPGLLQFRARLAGRKSIPLLTSEQFRLLKPLFIVRDPAAAAHSYNLYYALFFAAFFAVHFFWAFRRFAGDQTILPALVLLTGVGFVLMISLRDPLRDNLLFADFAQGVVAGAVLLAILSALDFRSLAGKLSYTPLLVSFALSALLIVFGSGPGTSDAKVNLFGFQPVEIIRILLVFFLAGYFATRWDVLRHARERRPLFARFNIPPLEFTLPAAICVLLSIAFFFLQKDMGPALVFAGLFLALYGIARGHAFVPVAGIAVLIAAFAAGFFLGVPHNVGDRVSMWLSPWNNTVHGGDQLAHSLWAFATGGVTGTGIGLGNPAIVPAAHTDLILAALGEEWGFLGVAAAVLLLAYLVWRAFVIARRARSDYEFFLAAGLGAATALQLLLIAAGALGLFPLSGVVTPFLSYGRTAMIANFAVFAILLSISARPGDEQRRLPMLPSLNVVAVIFGVLFAAVLAKAAYVQAYRSAAIMGEGTLVIQADGERRYQYNPRFQLVTRDIPMGSVYDRNGLPLATSSWDELEKHRAEYKDLGVDIDQACSRTESRHYPFGGLTFDLLGDLRTRTRWAASNTSFIERDLSRRLRGYDDRPTLVQIVNPKTHETERVLRYDYRELVPLLRYRHDPANPAVRKILDRKRDVQTSIDVRLQVQVAAILKKQLDGAKQDRGAAVVLDPATGDLLAAVSYPMPVLDPTAIQPAVPTNADSNPYLDRARYGLYPPGSTFKVVTAIAALRKDPALTHKTYQCVRLPDGRVGNFINGSNRPIRDDVEDKNPHGTLDLEHGLIVSCNAYFAQLGDYDVGAEPLFNTANLLGILTASPNTAAQLKKSLPQSSYGQGQVVASPFQMARVAATIANGGSMPEGRWITDENNARTNPLQPIFPADQARILARFMREVVTSGTGRRAAAAVIPMAGKTGTAELADAPSHAWFIGFAPYGVKPAQPADAGPTNPAFANGQSADAGSTGAASENAKPTNAAGSAAPRNSGGSNSAAGNSAATPAANSTGANSAAANPAGTNSAATNAPPKQASPVRQIAFAILVENGIYGGTAAAPGAAEIVNAAVKLGLIRQ